MKSSIRQCPINEAVVCLPRERHCADCNWNPEVARKQLEKICQERGIKLPEEESTDD